MPASLHYKLREARVTEVTELEPDREGLFREQTERTRTASLSQEPTCSLKGESLQVGPGAENGQVRQLRITRDNEAPVV